ncbi:CdiA C-terminal domain-containing protein [Paenibacillus pini]|uniref:tRNA nuclease CdiA C-terminal domain-containing protein n=1 Tax=Paenibacillus pini JCM 16418 TaxID=1236976 RepID=W7Z888_9BACL|nr:WXG100 family type VII secretion target [Paenibacillus pini]GAF10619.1 hypothetical protein JCM16418_4834 [Paenibacillus pini JCM 16418]
MTRIIVSPDQLLTVANQFECARQEVDRMSNQLKQQILWLQYNWDGVTQQKFYAYYQESVQIINIFVPLVNSIKEELIRKSIEFRQADETKESNSFSDELNPFEKSLNSIKDIGVGIYNDAVKRSENKFNSVGSFLDYITSGIPKGVYQGYTDRAGKWLDSPNDFANYMTLGIHGMLRETMFPDDSWSSKHWSNIFGTAGLVIGSTSSGLFLKEQKNFIRSFTKDDLTSPVDENIHKQKEYNSGRFIGNIEELKPAERKVAEELIFEGRTVERIQESTAHGEKTPDFRIDGKTTELKSLQNPNVNTGVGRIKDGFKQHAEIVIIDGRDAGLTMEQASQIIERAKGTYNDKRLPGKVQIWTNEGKINSEEKS